MKVSLSVNIDLSFELRGKTSFLIEKEEVKILIRDIILYGKLYDRELFYYDYNYLYSMCNEDERRLDDDHLEITVGKRFMWVYTSRTFRCHDGLCPYLYHTFRVSVKKCPKSIKFISDLKNNTAEITQEEVWQVMTGIEAFYSRWTPNSNILDDYTSFYRIKISKEERKKYLDRIEKEGISFEC